MYYAFNAINNHSFLTTLRHTRQGGKSSNYLRTHWDYWSVSVQSLLCVVDVLILRRDHSVPKSPGVILDRNGVMRNEVKCGFYDPQQLFREIVNTINMNGVYIETKISSFWQNFHHWSHWKMSFWQLPAKPVMKLSSKWQRFSDNGVYRYIFGIESVIGK